MHLRLNTKLMLAIPMDRFLLLIRYSMLGACHDIIRTIVWILHAKDSFRVQSSHNEFKEVISFALLMSDQAHGKINYKISLSQYFHRIAQCDNLIEVTALL